MKPNCFSSFNNKNDDFLIKKLTTATNISNSLSKIYNNYITADEAHKDVDDYEHYRNSGVIMLRVYSMQAMEVIDYAIRHLLKSYDFFSGNDNNPFMSNISSSSSPKFFNYDFMTDSGEFFLALKKSYVGQEGSSLTLKVNQFNISIDFIKTMVESYRCHCIAELQFNQQIDTFTCCSDMLARHIEGAERLLRWWNGVATLTEEDKNFIGQPLNPFERERYKELLKQRNIITNTVSPQEKLDLIKSFLNK